MISSIDPAPSVISCGGQSALFLSACPQGFQEIFQQGAKGPEKNRCITPAARNAICLIRYAPRSLACQPSQPAPLCCVWPYGMPVIRPHRRFFHPRTAPPAKVFGREGRGEGEPFSKKVSLSASCSLFKSSSVCLPSPKQKNPRRSGDKKDPLALRAARGSRTIFGSGLLSHMTLCSIIGDGELNFRVRNGVGCTLSSMATKEIWQIY